MGLTSLSAVLLLAIAACSGEEGPAPADEFRLRGGGEEAAPLAEADKDLQAGIQAATRQNQPQIRACYEQRLREVPSLDGRVELKIRASEGRIIEVGVTENSTRDKALETCIVQRVRRWQLGEASIPFAFSK